MSNETILIVEDDDDLREALTDTIALHGYQSHAVESAENALVFLKNEKPKMVISDVNLGGMGGDALLKVIHKQFINLPVILMTAYGTVSKAVESMKEGAVDYLTKPFDSKLLIDKINSYAPKQSDSKNLPIAEASQSKALLEMCLRVAKSQATVLITGDSGTGKEVLAHFIHENSSVSTGPFVAINCAAIPENMLEATLFGYEKGAFTGAYQSTPGKFEQAQNGTLLLDEISEMSLALQAKLLRVLQEKEVERLGGRKVISLNVRVIATSNRNLKDEVKANRFREDLYYRLNVFPVHWLPLSKRIEDILPLAEYIIRRHAQSQMRAIPTFSEDAKKTLLQYPWPGNVREMDNVLQRALILQSGIVIQKEDLIFEFYSDSNTNELTTVEQKEDEIQTATSESLLGEDLKHREFQVILSVFKNTKGDRQAMADALGISPRTLRYKLAKMRENGLVI